MIFCLLTWRIKSFQDGVYSLRKEFAPMGEILSFNSRPQFIREAIMKMIGLYPLKVYPFSLMIMITG